MSGELATPIYGPAFALDRLATETLPVVSKDLMPWLHKDRREAVDGCMVKDQNGKFGHDGSGLLKAERSLRTAEAALSANPTDPKVLAFLREQVAIARGKVPFYRGKIYLLDRIIGITHAAP